MRTVSISERIIKQSFYLSVWLINQLANAKVRDQQYELLKQMEQGTLGEEILKCLKKHNLRLVPFFESHDLKHILLNYKMTPLDEIRLQAFNLGNGNWSIPSVAIFIFGALLLPGKWRTFYEDFQEGLKALPIKEWDFEGFAHRSLNELRAKVFDHNPEAVIKWQSHMYHKVTYTVMVLGAVGMLFCFPFLWSAHVADLIGAGLPFVAGSIMLVGGLINLTLLNRGVQAPVATTNTITEH